MISRSIKGKVLVFAVFFIGIATGILIANFYESRSAQMRRESERDQRVQRAQRNVKRFHDYLGLSEQQRGDVSKIMEDIRAEMRKLSQESQPRFQAIEEASRSKVRGLMSEEQRLKYDEFLASRANGRGGGGGGDGGDAERDGGRYGDREQKPN